jgi:GNAT superfamily N-acetyltransferase
MEIRRIRADEGAHLRALRLRALADTPTAFSQTLAEAQRRMDDEWAAFAQKVATSETDATFVAEEHGQWYGMAGALVHGDDPGTVMLVAMWVDPVRRQLGVGASLVEAVVGWARARDARLVDLWVTETNEGALALYLRQGFVPTDRKKPLPSNPGLQQMRMVRALK